MVDYKARIAELEAELSRMQYNKATQHHYGLIRAKIAQLKKKDEARSAKGGKSEGYEVRKTGDGTVLLLGFPSTGKSTLLNALTGAKSEVGAYAFTTLTIVPGMLKYKHARIQILDVPGIVQGAASGRGRGKEVLSTMRSADLAVILVDVTRPEELAVIRREVYDTNIRLDQRKPDVRVKKKARGGIRIGRTVATPLLDNATIEAILKEFRINNADVTIRSPITADELIDVLEGNRVYIPSVLVVNKADLATPEQLARVAQELKPDLIMSAKRGDHLDELKELIFTRLDLIRIYLKEPGKPADMEVPLIMFRGSTVRAVCEKLHRDFVSKFKFARVWGPSARFAGQRLMLGHHLKDGDVLEIHLR
ncbi:GTP-binding protein [Candidatus Woesearchaeota archaeon]|nr:MAG: GTP-binding protein [Candidatus Woesearchaeota archaeon]